MHRLSGSLLLAYHGCDAKVAERLLAGEPFRPSANAYDWLGEGIYFWENNPRRGFSYARELQRKRRSQEVKTPAVVGAVINPGLCLDLTTEAGIVQLESAFQGLRETFEAGWRKPPNKLSRPPAQPGLRGHQLFPSDARRPRRGGGRYCSWRLH